MSAVPALSRLLFTGPLWTGSTARHRQEAFTTLPGVTVASMDSGGRVGRAPLIDRLLFRLRWPRDRTNFNERLLREVRRFRPDGVVIDSVPVVRRSTLRALHQMGVRATAFYSPDDVSAPHVRTRQLAACEPVWDVLFTTKSFNVPELRARGVRHPLLVGKSYHPPIHRPWAGEEVGEEYERFDVLLAAVFEHPREALVYACVEAGLSIVVLGAGWDRVVLPSSCVRRPNAWDADYARALHLGKVALCPLRRISRDRITARSIEIPACRRTMVAEETAEHDAHFENGVEYVSYENPAAAAAVARLLVQNEEQRRRIARAGRVRCEKSGYSTYDRAAWMWGELCARARPVRSN